MSQYVANKNFFSERLAITANSRISQSVRQRVPHRQTGHGECPSAVGAEPVARHDQLSSAGGVEMLPRRDARDRLAEIRQVLGCLSMQAAEHHGLNFGWGSTPELAGGAYSHPIGHLFGGEGVGCPLPKNLAPFSALQASILGPLGLGPGCTVLQISLKSPAKKDGGSGANWNIRRAKLQSNHYLQQPTNQHPPFYRTSNSVKVMKGKSITFHRLAHPKLTCGLPTLSLTMKWS